nr:hypothetical protein [uncultured Desulfobacter sp.]
MSKIAADELQQIELLETASADHGGVDIGTRRLFFKINMFCF